MTRLIPYIIVAVLAFYAWQYLKIEAQADREYDAACDAIQRGAADYRHRR